MSGLVEEAARLYSENRTEELLRYAADQWPSEGVDLPEGVGEVCRFAFIRCYELGLIDQHLWRARAHAAAILEGAPYTTACLMLQPFFVAVDDAVNETQEGFERGFAQAREILDLMARLVSDGHPRAGLVRRLRQEKLAFSYLMEATRGGRPGPSSAPIMEQAEREYRSALEETPGDARGALKIRGSLALVGYLELADRGRQAPQVEKTPFIEETLDVLNMAAQAGYDDVTAWAATNLAVMVSGRFEGWAPYDVA